MQKAIVKIYVKGRLSPLVTFELDPDPNVNLEDLVKSTMDDLYTQLNARENRVIRVLDYFIPFGEFKRLVVKYK